MIPILLLICVSCVGVLGVVAMGLGLKQQYVRNRDARGRITARNVVERIAREQPRPALKPTPMRTAATSVPEPVGDLTGVIATLEESVRFATVPAHHVPAPAAPRRAAKGSVAPPMVRVAVAAAPVQPPIKPQMYPVVHVAKPPPIPALPRKIPPPPPARRR